MSQFSLILPAAGASSRFRQAGVYSPKKVFAQLDGKPVWLHAVDAFATFSEIKQRILAVSPDDLDWVRSTWGSELDSRQIKLLAGGASRAETVQNCLAAVDEGCGYVAVHDAARPLVDREVIARTFAAAVLFGAAIPGIAVSSTIKRVDQSESIVSTVPREELRAAQTPQVFDRKQLATAFANYGVEGFTDEAMLVERAGGGVRVVPGSPKNLKITGPDDLIIAGALLSCRNTTEIEQQD